MKTLPDNPNLDHLRRQAKDLLAGLRDSRTQQSLADAQAMLAQRYGFRTWTDLKAEVDRRRGQADVADEKLARAVAACFGLGEVTGPMRSVARADEMGRRWSLETERGRWAVRTMDTWRPIVDAETDVALQEAAAGAGILLPTPVRGLSGAIVESVGGHSWRAYEWIHSGPPLIAPVSAAVTHEVGRILARIHRLGLPAPGRISPYHNSHRSAGWIAGAGPVPEADWRELAARARTRHADWAPALTEAIPTLVDLGTIGEGATPPQPVLCHNTLGPGSVRLGSLPRAVDRAVGGVPGGAGGGGPSKRRSCLVVVGWEHAGGLPPSWELGDALTHWAVDPDNGVNVAGARAMIEGYQSEAGVLPPLDMAMFRGAVIALGNYVFDQVEDALTARDAGDQQHTARSVRHVLPQLSSRARSRANLEQLLDVALATAHS